MERGEGRKGGKEKGGKGKGREKEPIRGSRCFGEVDAFAREKGLELFDIRKRFWRRDGCPKRNVSPGQLVFADALYLRAPENLLGVGQMPEEKIIRAFCVYLSYERDDLARLLMSEANTRGMLSRSKRELAASVLARFRKVEVPGSFRQGVAREMDGFFSAPAASFWTLRR